MEKNGLNLVRSEFKFIYDRAYEFFKAEELIRFLKKIGIPLTHKLVLDLGCGSCGFTYYLHSHIHVVGVDIQKHTLVARKMIEDIYDVNLNIVRGSGLKLPFSSAKFDLVFLLDVIEHVDNPSILLDEVQRLLKPEGFAVLFFPPYYSAAGGHCNIPYLHYFSEFIIKKYKPDQFQYRDYGLNRLTIRKLERIVKETDLFIWYRKMVLMHRFNKKQKLLDLISKTFLREFLFSWLYILKKK